MMAALKSLLFELEKTFFRFEIEHVAIHREPAHLLPRKMGRRVLEEELLVLSKVRVERDADEPVFLLCRDLEGSRFGDFL